MIQSVQSFIRYFESIRQRTLNFARAIPAGQIEWGPENDEFTCGDILRHLAAIETITIQEVVDKQWGTYPGHAADLARGLGAVFAYLEDTHKKSMSKLATLPDAALHQPRADITGQPIKAWRLLMAMVEHEVHHRSQLASYLALMGFEPPQLYGLQVDEVAALSAERGKDS